MSEKTDLLENRTDSAEPEATEKNPKHKGFAMKAVVAVCGTALTCFILLKTPVWGTAILLTVLTGLMAFELTVPTGLVESRTLQELSIAFAACVPWLVYFHVGWGNCVLVVFAFMVIVFAYSVLTEHGHSVEEMVSALLGAFLFPSIISLYLELFPEDGGRRPLVLLPLAIAWACDAMAQITGMLLGKHKAKRIESISPNKTFEGFLGGGFGSLLGVTIYAFVLQHTGLSVNWLLFLALGLVGSLFAILGDLSLSYIKRSRGIKDFGHLIPEHGGVLDRFDSVLFVVPLVYAASPYLLK